jgi:hypothetical protein
MYFANNDGVLRFDGLHCDLTEVSLASPIRSILVDSNNNIYVGLFNNFGIIKQNISGRPFFESLRHLIPDSNISFDDIWKIHEIPQGIVFQSFDYLFLLSNNKIEVIRPETKFQYFNLALSETVLNLNNYITVSADVKNIGNIGTDEIVQLYIRDRIGTVTRPVKELKGFRKIYLNPGESKKVEFNIDAKDLEFFNGKEFVTEQGEFDVWIGPNSAEGLHNKFEFR